ncbi:MAG TPA: hypothetical protein VNH18_14615 [Bryobacteraceae bacterium]|nr:hypothetical protein [Bryobacteraceae bacterium]
MNSPAQALKGETTWKIGAQAIYRVPGTAPNRVLATVIFLAWLGVVVFLACTHLVWRDEVRAMSVSLKGGNVFAMLKGLHGEGHPAVWYLLVRAGHALVPHPESMLLVSIAVGAAAILVLLLRSPFSLPFLLLLLATRFGIYEYTVMARNYGLSMLLMFLFVVFYERHRNKDYLLGVLLFLLVNCNVPSVLLAAGLLLFWFIDISFGDAPAKSADLRLFAWNAAIAVFGVSICFITVFPTYSDSAAIDRSNLGLQSLFKAVLLPSLQYEYSSRLPFIDKMARGIQPLVQGLTIFKSVILLGSTLGLLRRRAALVAALTTLVVFSLFFVIVYPAGYRHQALWLSFMVCMYWLAGPGDSRHKADPSSLANKALLNRLATAGTALFVLLLILQLPYRTHIFESLINPFTALKNRNDHIGSILAAHPELKQAVVVADPDFLVETLPYYVSNPTYLMREQRYGNVVHFTRTAKLELSLGDVLTNARRLSRETSKPIVILLLMDLDSSLPAYVFREGYNWKLTVTPEQVREFQASTRLIQHHSAPPDSDEKYSVYVLDN